MAKKNNAKGLGWWAFIAGLIIAVVAGYTGRVPDWTWLLVVLGLVVGYFNISKSEAVPFLLSTVALIVAGSAELGSLWAPISGMLEAVVIFVAPAAIVVAVKTVYEIAQ
jgi:hypothetical protein